MEKQLKNRKRISKAHIVWIVLGLLVAIFAARTLIWEYQYLRDKEGSPRAAAISVSNTDDQVDESDVTDDDKNNYVVAADRPRFLSIDKLGIDRARVYPVGVSSSNQLQTPTGIHDVGWYVQSGTPGTGGVMVIDGHNGGPTRDGVFKHLPELVAGDLITIERGDGTIFNYRVVENMTLSISEANSQMSTLFYPAETGKEGLSLITCTGEWSQKQRTYLSRAFLRAVLV